MEILLTQFRLSRISRFLMCELLSVATRTCLTITTYFLLVFQEASLEAQEVFHPEVEEERGGAGAGRVRGVLVVEGAVQLHGVAGAAVLLCTGRTRTSSLARP